MSLLHQALVFDRYGARLGISQLADALGIAEQTIYNQIAKKTFPITTYVDGGKRFCDYRDFAKHLDVCRDRASSPA